MPLGPRKLIISFSAKNLTRYGGAYLLHRFFSKIGLKRALCNELLLKQCHPQYSVGEMILALLYPIILGIERLEATQLLKQNGIFQHLTGLPSYPDATSLRKFLQRTAPQLLPRLRKLHDRFLRRMSERLPHRRRLVFDVDSTVLVLYGKQEGAKVGYNPVKRGRPSYHPLLCFEGQTLDCWHGQLRPGNVHTATGMIELLEACFAKRIDLNARVIIRADKGFFDKKVVQWLKPRNARFVIVARLTQPIKRRLRRLRYHTVSPGVEASEFFYRPHKWKERERFVVIRRPKSEENESGLKLFQIGRYRYQVFVTNLTLKPLNLWRFYNDRAGVELLIRELKASYSLRAVPTHSFQANETYFHLLLLAYNLINWFKRLCLPPHLQNATLHTLRDRILMTPAQLSNRGHHRYLLLPIEEQRQKVWRYALRKIQRLRP